MKIKHIKQSNYNLNMLQTKKFKTTRIQITFANDLSKETATKRALLPYLLRSVSKKFPSRNLVSAHLDEMYSANFGVGVKKIGLTQIVVFDLSIINDKYTLNNESLLDEGLDFINEILFNPLFIDAIFNEEKRLLEEYFVSIYANKMRYTIKKMFEHMFKDEPFNVQALGDEDSLRALILEDIQEAYNNMLLNDLININVIGDINFDVIAKKINNKLLFTNRTKKLQLIDDSKKPVRDAFELIESQEVNQAKLAIGYQLPVYYKTDNYYKAIVFNTLIGSGSESLLFKTIREKLSLVYFINSGYDHYKGIFTVYSGINQKDYTQVINEIDKTIEDTKNLNYDDKVLVIAKKTIINSLIESLDSNGSLITRINNLSLFEKELDIENLINKINEVTKNDIRDIANLLKKDTTFLLRNDSLE